MTSKLYLRRLVEVLSTNLLRVTQSVFCSFASGGSGRWGTAPDDPL